MNPVAGQDARTRIAPEAARTMRDAISEADGREVFFAGTLDGQGLVRSARVLARGHQGAVPAIFEGLEPRDIVLHNHPSGDVEPSDADLDLAVVYSHNGHGVYIVDNEVSRTYVVVEPFREKDRTYLDAGELGAAIGPESRLAALLPGYEQRPQQRRMLACVADAFNEDGIAVVEAPTGVGKTLAYLVPAVFWAVRNRERVVVSTRTINLQEQIVEKDIPVLLEALDLEFSAVLVKGRSNYLCPRRLERALSEATLFEDDAEQAALKAIAEWAEHTEDGSRSDLPFVPQQEVWERVCSESDTCTAQQCMAAKNCFLSKARRQIAKADVLVVNHHMLFSDLAIKKELGSFTSVAVLPAFERLIIDEAHHIEDSATEYFGAQATQSGALALLGRFSRQERGQERGLLPYIKVKIVRETSKANASEVDAILDLIDNALLPSVGAAREGVRAAFHAVRDVTAERCRQVGREIKWRLTQEILDDEALRAVHAHDVLPACEELMTLAQHGEALAGILKDLEPGPNDAERPLALECTQLQAYILRLRRLATTLADATSAVLEPNTVRWVEIDADRPHIVRLIRCPLEAGAALAEWVYPNLKSIAMTSATLAVGQNFEFFQRRVGLDRPTGRTAATEVLDSPFDFESQAILCVAEDLPNPNDPSFAEESSELIRGLVKEIGGGAFVLYTSFGALNEAYRRLESGLRDAGLAPLKQGSEPRGQLLDRFRNTACSVLFGTDSFWEGVDVAGDALQCVILTRLPFRVPTEPIFEARTEAIEESGGNAFMEYTVPLAVIKFRQGFGRLIRRRSDRGAVAVLDSRILSQRYGRIFLKSLPPLRRVVGSGEAILGEVRSFFHTTEGGLGERRHQA